MRVLVRCDGGGPIGVGHVIRSLALAEAAVAAGHDVVVAGHFEGPFLQGQLAAAPVEVVQLARPMRDGDLQPVIDLVGRLRPDVLHVDSYGASDRLGGLGGLVASAGVEALVSNVEDGTYGRRPADVVIDPTLGAELSARPDDGSTWLLRGSRYTPVRQRVMDARQRACDGNVVGEVGQVARSVLVVMGGTDPVGLAPAAVELLARTGLALDVTAIATGENAERARAAAEGSRLSLNVLAPVDDLAAMMSGQDLVISAAGTSVWELCCIGVPMAVVWAVDNQREGYDRVVAAGAAVGLGGPELGGDELGGDELGVGLLRRALTDSRVRNDLVLAGRQVVDGLGAWRVVRTWEQALRLGRSDRPGSSNRLRARPATLQDSRLLWEWRNDPATRAASRSSAEVPWDDHLRWLTESLTRTDRMLLVVEESGGTAASVETVGTVRWDLEREGEWQVSITVAPDRRGQSLARPLLRAGEVALSEVARSSGTDVTAYLAVVHIDNSASLRLFETSAYVPDLPPDPQGFMWLRKTARVP
ncbi:MAG: UDP-2,4-diacetamido-2,4,6-trideoxy-beta-L-altropyranose hydrolase [Actinobacteria bacterium]|nr:UDP-2,4-diacetamido-2,4,6-trideoxy-beta-L-altropyranose hydrolase [Actinomycetota bacterium]